MSKYEQKKRSSTFWDSDMTPPPPLDKIQTETDFCCWMASLTVWAWRRRKHSFPKVLLTQSLNKNSVCRAAPGNARWSSKYSVSL